MSAAIEVAATIELGPIGGALVGNLAGQLITTGSINLESAGLAVAVAAVTQGIDNGIGLNNTAAMSPLQLAANTFEQGAVSSAVGSLVYGGSFGHALEGDAIASLASLGAGQIGANLPAGSPGSVLAHTALGCAASAAEGTGCASGAIGGAVSAGLNPLVSSATNGQLNPAAMTAISTIASGSVAGALGYNVQGATTAAENETLNNFCDHNSCGQALSTFLSKVSNGIDTAINAGADVSAQDSATNLDLLKGISNTTINASTFSLPGTAGYVPYFSYSNPTIGSIGELYGAVGLSELATYGVSGTVATGSANATNNGSSSSSVWSLNPFARGTAIEQQLGQNLPQNFPVIDIFDNGMATSIKSLNVDANSYQSTATLSRTLNGYIDDVAGYNGTGPNGWAGVKIDSSQITGRGLDLVIPAAGSTAQQQAINQAVQYGLSKGVTVNVIVHP